MYNVRIPEKETVLRNGFDVPFPSKNNISRRKTPNPSFTQKDTATGVLKVDTLLVGIEKKLKKDIHHFKGPRISTAHVLWMVAKST